MPTDTTSVGRVGRGLELMVVAESGTAAGGDTYVRAIAFERAYGNRARTEHCPGSDGRARNHHDTRSKLGSVADRHVSRQVSVGMQRHEVAEHIVVRDLTMHVDGREAADPDVDGDDR